eukprot:g20848.t1
MQRGLLGQVHDSGCSAEDIFCSDFSRIGRLLAETESRSSGGGHPTADDTAVVGDPDRTFARGFAREWISGEIWGQLALPLLQHEHDKEDPLREAATQVFHLLLEHGNMIDASSPQLLFPGGVAEFKKLTSSAQLLEENEAGESVHSHVYRVGKQQYASDGEPRKFSLGMLLTALAKLMQKSDEELAGRARALSEKDVWNAIAEHGAAGWLRWMGPIPGGGEEENQNFGARGDEDEQPPLPLSLVAPLQNTVAAKDVAQFLNFLLQGSAWFAKSEKALHGQDGGSMADEFRKSVVALRDIAARALLSLLATDLQPGCIDEGFLQPVLER